VDYGRAIRTAAADLGFIHCAFSAAVALPRQRFLDDWLASGRAGEMHYLARRVAERMDPRMLLPGARSVVSLAYPYKPPPAAPENWQRELRGRIAAYAWGEDYHDGVGRRVRQLADQMCRIAPGIRTRYYVDTGPVLEREWAYRAGAGWFGKNTMLLDRRAGSWFFLAEILTDLELPTGSVAPDRCGTCRRCIDACPTGALDAEYLIDSRRCISYLTIEHRNTIPVDIRAKLENWVFGCDVCQEVCPWNGDRRNHDSFEALSPRLTEILDLDEAAFRTRYRGTAITRAKRRGFVRNAAVALGNSGNREAVPALRRALSDTDPLVRGHVAWALGRLGGPVATACLERAQHSEIASDLQVRQEIEAALVQARDGRDHTD
jgi:epoxyqueuosine reductase